MGDSIKNRKEYQHQWYLNNKDRVYKNFQRWQKANPEKVKGYRNKEQQAQYNRDYYLKRKKEADTRKEVNAKARVRYHERYKENLKIKHKKYRKNNALKVLESQRNWRSRNPQKVAGYVRKYRVTHREKTNALALNRRMERAQRTPPWARKMMTEYLPEMYSRAKELFKTTGVKHEIDHIVPLRGKLVSGLHVPWNLRLLPASQNLKKGNRFNLTEEVIVGDNLISRGKSRQKL